MVHPAAERSAEATGCIIPWRNVAQGFARSCDSICGGGDHEAERNATAKGGRFKCGNGAPMNRAIRPRATVALLYLRIINELLLLSILSCLWSETYIRIHSKRLTSTARPGKPPRALARWAHIKRMARRRVRVGVPSGGQRLQRLLLLLLLRWLPHAGRQRRIVVLLLLLLRLRRRRLLPIDALQRKSAIGSSATPPPPPPGDATVLVD